MDMFLQGRRQCPKENRLEVVDRVTHGKRKEEDKHSRRRG